MSGLVIGLAGTLATVIVALIGWFGGRRNATATAEKTTGEGWDLLTKGLTTRMTALEKENGSLRSRVTHAEDEIALLRRTLIENNIPIPTIPAAS